jgi:glucose-6-phosphate 1-dehydrogenase
MADRQDNLAKPSSAAEDDGPAPLAPPCAVVIFGAAGDLTKRLVVPALYNLVEDKRLPEGFQLVGVDLAAKSTEEWRLGLTDMMNEFVAKGGGEFEADHIDQTAWRWLTSRMSYLQGDLNDPGMYQRLGKHLAELEKSAGTAGNCLFYLAVADRFFKVVVAGLGAAGLTTEPDNGAGW